MATLKTKMQGDSLTIGISFNAAYDMSRIEHQYVYLNDVLVTSSIVGSIIRVELRSDQTIQYISTVKLTLVIDDSVFGIRKTDLGYIYFTQSSGTISDESINEGYDLVVSVVVDETATTATVELLEAFRGYSSYDIWLKYNPSWEGTEEEWNAAYNNVYIWAIAETARSEAETIRLENEIARGLAEQLRIEAEGTRDDAEDARISAETTRGSNETTRIANENIRIASETVRNAQIKYDNLHGIAGWLQDKFLFLGRTSAISAGLMPNDLGTDSLVVDGTLYSLPETKTEIVTNHTFDTDTGWWKDGGTIPGDGYAHLVHDGSGAMYRSVYLAGLLTVGALYKVTYSLPVAHFTSGPFKIWDGGSVFCNTRSAGGVGMVEYIRPATNNLFFSVTSGGNCYLDDVYVEKVEVDADYISADTDRLWLDNTHDTVVSVPSEKLVSCDMERTVVMYADSSPYAIKMFGILKSGETFTADELNVLHNAFGLSIFWGDTLNEYGVVKQNRAGKQNSYVELLVNGSITTDIGWTKDTQFTVEDRSFYSNFSGLARGVRQTLAAALVVGEWYRVSLDIDDYVSGQIRALIDWDGVETAYFTGDGHHYADFKYVAGSIQKRFDLRSDAIGFSGKIRNISLYKL
jgi:hypothetical protein